MGGQGPVEPVEVSAPQALHGFEDPRCLREEVVDINRLTPGSERSQVRRSPLKHVDGSVMVAVAYVVHRDAELKDSLVHAANVTRLRFPQLLERLMLFEIVTPV